MKAFREYAALASAIEKASTIPPCQVSDSEAWFPDTSGPRYHSNTTAKKLCFICPVQRECLTYALAGDEQFGTWGGLNTEQRKKLKSTFLKR
jgi:WhiB family redox-sensing transcriptional regulator|tara:strand:- start:124 stop:399 length:276 start_codon:yes stop_codon:yes gene_type:complete